MSLILLFYYFKCKLCSFLIYFFIVGYSFVPFVSVELSRIISILDFDPWKKMNESNERITSKFLSFFMLVYNRIMKEIVQPKIKLFIFNLLFLYYLKCSTCFFILFSLFIECDNHIRITNIVCSSNCKIIWYLLSEMGGV